MPQEQTINKIKTGAMLATLVIAILAIALVMTPPAHAGQAEPSLEKIVSNKELRVCYIIYSSFIIKDPNTGDLSGSFVDAIRHIAAEAGWNITFKEATWANWTAALQSGQCDVSIAATIATISRATSVSFTTPLWYVGNSAIVKKGDMRFSSISDFNKSGVRIAVAQGEASQTFAQKYLTAASITVISTAAGGDLTLPMLEVSAGRADVALSDAYTTAEYAAKHPEVTDLFAENPFDTTGVSWAVNHEDTELLDFLNTSISEMKDSGKLLEMTNKYGAKVLTKKIIWETS